MPLTVSPEGTAMAMPDTFDGLPGDNVTFNCSSLGGPGNSFTWMKQNDKQVIGSEPQLIITDLDALDGGQYQCIVENSAGNDSTDVTVYSELWQNANNIIMYYPSRYSIKHNIPNTIYSWACFRGKSYSAETNFV